MFPLTEQQRNHLAAALDHVDEALLQVLDAARPGMGPAPDRFLRQRLRDLPPGLAPELAGAVQRVRSRLGDDIGRLGLRVDAESTARRLAAYLSAAVVLLQDSHSAAMRAYGDVDPELAATLDPWLAQLEADLSSIRRAIETRPSGAALPVASRRP